MKPKTVDELYCNQQELTRAIDEYKERLYVCGIAGAFVFAVFPAPAAQTFGKRYGAQVYSIILLSSFSASLFDTILNKVLYDY